MYSAGKPAGAAVVPNVAEAAGGSAAGKNVDGMHIAETVTSTTPGWSRFATPERHRHGQAAHGKPSAKRSKIDKAKRQAGGTA